MILVSLQDKRKRTSPQIITSIAKKMKSLDLERKSIRVDIQLQGSEFAAVGSSIKPIILEVKGYDFNTMELLVSRLKTWLAKIPGIINIDSDIGEKSPETKLVIQKKRAALYGISAMDVTQTEARQVILAAANGCLAALSAEKHIFGRKKAKADWH